MKKKFEEIAKITNSNVTYNEMWNEITFTFNIHSNKQKAIEMIEKIGFETYENDGDVVIQLPF